MGHYYRKYGDLESMIQDLNASIRRLRSYLNEGEIKEIVETTTIKDFKNFFSKIEVRSELKLADPISTSCGDVTTVEQAIKQCSNIEQCARIERAWRDCRNNCLDVKDTIDAMKDAINRLSNDVVKDETAIESLVQICNHTRDCGVSFLSTGKLKTIYEDTIKEPYETSCAKPFSYTIIIICLVSVLLLLLVVSLLSCKVNENKANCIELCQCENVNSLISYKTVVSINNKECEVDLCKPCNIVINQNDTISIAKIDNTYMDNMMHLILYNDTTTVLDTSFSLKTGFHYKCKNSPANRIRIIPIIKPEGVNLCKNEDCPPCSHYLYKIVMFALLIVALLLALLILRPILQRKTEYHNKTNEKILNERLKVQNDWQEILQAKYRLDIQRGELNLNIREKQEKADIDEHNRDKENAHRKEMAEMEHETELIGKALDLYKSLNSQQNNISQQQLKDLVTLLSKLTSK